MPANPSPPSEHPREDDNPALNHIMMRNIRTIIELRQNTVRERGLQERLADVVTNFSGSMLFVYVHIIWFGLWILLNAGLFGLPASTRSPMVC